MIGIILLYVAYSPEQPAWLSMNLHVFLAGRHEKFSHQSPAVPFWRSSTTNCRNTSGVSYPCLSPSPLCLAHSFSTLAFFPLSRLLALTADTFRKLDSTFGQVLPFFLTCHCVPTDVQAVLENQVSAYTCCIISHRPHLYL